MKKTVTIDFDGTLQIEEVQEFVRNLIFNGVIVNIVSARLDDLHLRYGSHNGTNSDLYAVADRLGIKRGRIFFTNGKLKYKFFRDVTPDLISFHLDNNKREVKRINKHTFVKAILLKEGWQEKCYELLK